MISKKFNYNRKKYIVYAIINNNLKIEYIGHTNNLRRRFKEHFNSKIGSFYNRKDCIMTEVKRFNTKEEALQFELKKQKKIFGITEREKTANNLFKIYKKRQEKIKNGITPKLKKLKNQTEKNFKW